MIFLRKIFLTFYSINRAKFIVWLPLVHEILEIMRIDQKFWTKIQIYLEQKDLLTWNKKHFPSFLKGFQLPEIVLYLAYMKKKTTGNPLYPIFVYDKYIILYLDHLKSADSQSIMT